MSSSPETVALWVEALSAFDEKNFNAAIQKLASIAQPSTYIVYDLGVIYQRMGRTSDASLCFRRAVDTDGRFALCYFKLGCLHLENKEYTNAIRWFERCEECFLGDRMRIDYEPLGLSCRLYRCEVVYNAALAYGLNCNVVKAVELLLRAKKEKQTKHHDVIDDTLRCLDQSADFSKFRPLVPKGDALFRPTKIPTTKKVDFLSSGKVIASQDPKDNYIGFIGLQQKDDTSATAEPSSQSKAGATNSGEGDLRTEGVPPPPPLKPPPRRAGAENINDRRTPPEPPPKRPPPRFVLP